MTRISSSDEAASFVTGGVVLPAAAGVAVACALAWAERAARAVGGVPARAGAGRCGRVPGRPRRHRLRRRVGRGRVAGVAARMFSVLDGRMGLGWWRGAQAVLGRDGEDDQPEHDRGARQQRQVDAVGCDHRQVAAAQRTELGQPVLGRRCGRDLPRRGRRPAPVHRGQDELLVPGRTPVLPRPVTARLGVERLEDLCPARLAEVLQAVLRRPEVGDLPARHQDQQPVADIQVGDAVRDHDDGAAVLGEAGHHLHDRLVEPGVQARGRLVQEQQRRLGHQLQRDVDPLLLAAGQPVGAGFRVWREGEFRQHLVHAAVAFGLARVPREPQFRGITKRAAGRQLRVEDVFLRDKPDPVPQLGVVLVQVAVVVQDAAAVGGPHPGQRAEQGGLPRAAGADDPEQAALTEREGDVVEQDLAAPQGDGQVAGDERDVAGVNELLQLVARQAERGGPDADDVALGQRRGHDLLAVDEGAVVAVQVDDLVGGADVAQLGVVARDAQIGDDDVVVGSTADPQHLGRQPADHAGLAVPGRQHAAAHGRPALRHGRPARWHDGPGGDDGRGPRGGLNGAVHLGPVDRVPEPDGGLPVEGEPGDPLRPVVGAVGAPGVLQDPGAAVELEDRMLPRHPVLVDDDVGGRVAADGVREGLPAASGQTPECAPRAAARQHFQKVVARSPSANCRAILPQAE